MSEPVVISSRQYSVLVALNIIGSAFLNIPSMLAAAADHNAWLAACVATIIALLLLPLYTALGRRFSGVLFTGYLENLLGKWAGKTVAIIFLLAYPFLIATLSLRNIGDFMVTQILQQTPLQAICVIFSLVVIMAVRLGLEVLGRAAELFFPVVLMLFLIMVVLISPQIKFEHVEPVMENGFMPVIKASMIFIAYPLLEPALLAILFPFVHSENKAGKSLFKGMLVGSTVLIIITTLAVLVLGTNLEYLNYPSYTLAKRISIGQFLERIEVIMAFIWFVTIFVRISLLFYIAISGISRSLNLKDYRVLTLPMAFLMVILALIVFPNTTYFKAFTPTYTVHSFVLGLGFPLLLWVIGCFKKKASKGKPR